MTIATSTLSRHARMMAAFSVLLAAVLLPLSFTGGVISTPAIQRALGGSPAALSWLTNGFMLTFGSFLLSAGVAADITGRKRIFVAGAALFCFSSAMIGLTQHILMAGLLRSLQGLAAAMILASGSAALARLYEGPERTRVFSMLGTLFGVGLAFGPVVIGFITDALGWRWVYAMLALLSGMVLLIGLLFLPGAEKRQQQKPAGAGLILFTAALILLTSAVMLIPAFGFFSLTVLALFLSAMLLFIGFVSRCQNTPNPALDISLLLRPCFAGILLLPVATCYCYVVLLIIIPLHFMGGDGMSEARSALYLLALTSPMLFFPSVAAMLTRWFSPAAVSATGLIIASAGLLFLGYALQSSSSYFLLFSLFITGAGAALPWGLMDGLALSLVPVEKAGMAAGLFNTVRVAGEGIALAMVSAFLTEMNALNLQKTVHGYAPDVIHHAAAWLGGGNTERAAAILPAISRTLLRGSYDSAYMFLFRVLAAVTLACALIVWMMLGRKAPE
ncbi:Multidrug resistance protein stp [Metakosakonia massiliensis]|uniref:Multidrug resistance protein stp n=1 Tax=Phytobacter massiliensis TaxID=1485952 RepID=A0A6N3B382_9ENTR